MKTKIQKTALYSFLLNLPEINIAVHIPLELQELMQHQQTTADVSQVFTSNKGLLIVKNQNIFSNTQEQLIYHCLSHNIAILSVDDLEVSFLFLAQHDLLFEKYIIDVSKMYNPQVVNTIFQ
ncbi:hypothetical protein SS50377_23059 [Spironucleus salmonicida]|uniref:Uncharacterized protein n=1 Tax=Spironucleus salmonicida TaxID=348837 RepID=A0A9P8LWC0_9EUKA|nr:hypothetical protein SS50377_23059 [Spironucleus salmonicida]